jgi:excinuclease ABC subunit C
MKNDTTIIYIGKAKDLFSRVNSYFTGSHNNKTTMMVSEVADFDYIIVENDKEALILEINLIKKHLPKYNILLVDDKSYPYIQITSDTYPRLLLTREVKKKGPNTFGPYPTNYSAFSLHQMLNDIFPFRKCANIPNKECLYFHMKKCLAPCINKNVDYTEIVKDTKDILKGNTGGIISSLEKQMEKESANLNFESAANIRDSIYSIKASMSHQIVEFTSEINLDVIGYRYNDNYLCINILIIRKGVLIDNYSQVYSYLDSPMTSINQILIKYYEDSIDQIDEIIIDKFINFKELSSIYPKKVTVKSRGAKKELIDLSFKNADNTLSNHSLLKLSKNDYYFNALNELKEIIGYYASYIEVFDNAHLFGVDLVSSVIVFKNNTLDKKEYRKYKLKANSMDDLASMEEVIYRRYFKLLSEDRQIPNIIMVDGGINQVNVASKVLKRFNIQADVIGLLKGDGHKLKGVVFKGQEIILAKNSNLFKFLLSLSEEVHRFTITYHRNLHKKTLNLSFLDNISGIGKITKSKLLKSFDSIASIKEANDETLKKIGLNIKQIEELKKGLKYYD